MTVDADSLRRDTLSPPDAQAQVGAQGRGQLKKVELWPGFPRLSPGSYQRETWRKDAEETEARAQDGGRWDAASTCGRSTSRGAAASKKNIHVVKANFALTT